MNEINFDNKNKLCKYQEYVHIDQTRESYDYGTHKKKLSLHKNRLSGFLNTSALNKTIQISKQRIQQKQNRQKAQNNSILNATLFRKNIDKVGKLDHFKLEKLFPKSVTIKFQQVLDSIPNNRILKPQKSPKTNKGISPFKVFQMAQSKFYLDLLNQNKRESQKNKLNSSSENQIESLFNVKSIKMIKKLVQTSPQKFELQTNKQQSKPIKKRNKYANMFKNQTQFSVEYEKQNPQHSDIQRTYNIKFSLKDLRKLDQYQARSNNNSKRRELLPLSQNQKRQSSIKKKENLRKTSQIQIINDLKDSADKQINQKRNRKNSKQCIPMVFSLSPDSSAFFSGYTRPLDNKFLIIKKPDVIFEEKINKYFKMLKQTAEQNEIQIVFPEAYSRNQLSYFIGRGNNSKLVKQTLKKRWWLGTCEEKKELLKTNMIWMQLKDKSYYNLKQKLLFNAGQMDEGSKKPILHNHFQQNEFLGNKKALFYNMSAYYKQIGQDVFSYLPLTFHITSLNCDSWFQFLTYFNKAKQNSELKNVWILKPGQNTNRGNGITIHQNLQTILSIITQSQKSGRTFILQKYIEKPFLYNKRKFDIRCYMLLTRLNGKIKGYWYKEGYIRTSGYEFTLSDCQNSFIHLTNDAIQQNCGNYGKYEDKNKLSYYNFQKYLDSNFNINQAQKKYDFEGQIIPKIRKVCIDSIKASYDCLGVWKQGLPTFQLFGLDFMIDSQFNPWLIEINTNPCLQTEGRVLQKVIIPLVDNVFKLSVDCIFPPPVNWSNSNKHLLSKNIDNNLFELVFDESKQQKSNRIDSIKQLPMYRIGQIDEDNQVYGQEQE